MKHTNLNTVSKRTALSAALCLALGAGAAQAAPWSGNFTMYSPVGGQFPPDNAVSGTEKSTLASNTPFFGFNWVAKSLTTYTSTFTVNTIEGGIYSGITPGAGQLGASLLFDWGAADASTACGQANCNIDVIMIWDVVTNADGSTSYTSTDITSGSIAPGSGWAGAKMIDGPFQGYSANFNMTTSSLFTVTLSSTQQSISSPILVTTGGGNVDISTNRSSSAGYSFAWSGDLTGVDLNTGGGTNVNGTTYRFDPTTLTNGQAYSVGVSVTNPNAETVALTYTITVEPNAGLTGTDTDGDGLADNHASEGYGDNDGDGIANFLDVTNDSATLVAVDTVAGLGSMSTNAGTLTLGSTAASNSVTSMLASGLQSGTKVAESDFASGTSDDVMNTSCVGGCFDFKVTGLTDGDIAKVVIPMATALPDYPIYRKFNNGKWNGFVINADNSISSAAALSTSPTTCPAAGDSAYSTVGLTPGHFCIQLTIKDGGGNDADGSANGTIVDPGGVANGKQLPLEANVPSGCSMSTTAVNPTERADWWLVAGFLGALAMLRGMRRKNHAA